MINIKTSFVTTDRSVLEFALISYCLVVDADLNVYEIPDFSGKIINIDTQEVVEIEEIALPCRVLGLEEVQFDNTYTTS